MVEGKDATLDVLIDRDFNRSKIYIVLGKV